MDREVWTKVWTQLKQPLCFMNGVSIKAKDFLEPASGGHQWYCTFHTGFNTYSVITREPNYAAGTYRLFSVHIFLYQIMKKGK